MPDTREDTDPGVSDLGRFSVAGRRVMAIQSAGQFLDMQMVSVRQLMDAQVRTRKLDQMQELAAHLGRRRAATAERAAEKLADRVDRELEGLAAAETNQPEKAALADQGVPIPLELLVVIRTDQIGPSAMAELSRDLTQACSGDQAAINYAVAYLHWMKREDPHDVLRRALLPIMVSRFEDFLASIIRVHWLSSTRETGDNDHLVGLANTAASAVVSKTPQKWASDIANRTDLVIGKVMQVRWHGVCEVFARRHAIIHAGDRFDADYQKRMGSPSNAPALGSHIRCSENYVSAALENLEGLADLIAVAFASSLAPGTDEGANFASEPVLRALQGEHWRDAEFLANHALSHLPDEHQHHELRVNRWMAESQLGEVDAERHRRDIAAWVPPGDQPATSWRAILLGDAQAAIGALDQLTPTEFMSVKTWPLVRSMCKTSPAFERYFNLTRSTGRGPSKQHRPSPSERAGGRRRR